MIIIYGESQQSESFLYKKDVNKKTYYYSGEIEAGTFIEEIVYNSIIDKYPNLKNEVFQTIVNDDKGIYLISFNDNLSGEKGESTLFYSTNEFTEDEIQGYISEFIFVDMEELWFLHIANNSYKFTREKDQIDFELTNKELRYEVMLSEFEKFKAFIGKIKTHIILIIIMGMIPILANMFLGEDFINSLKQGTIQSKNDVRKLTMEKEGLKQDMENSSKRYFEVIKQKDFFEDKEKLDSFKKNF